MGNSNVFKRNAGILMAISSLPSPYGIGTLGKDAYEFVDFVRDSNHKYWQVLPVGPTTYGDSPYQPYSAFAGNPYFVDLDMLIEEGLLLKSEVIAVDWGDWIIPVEVSEDDAVNNRYPVNHDGYLGDDRYVSYEKMYNGRFNVIQYSPSEHLCHGNFFITKDCIYYLNEQKRLINIEENGNNYAFLTSIRFLISYIYADDIYMSVIYDRSDPCSQILFGFDRKNGKSYKFKIKTDIGINEYRHEKGISKLLDNNRISSRLPSDDHLSLIKNKLNEIEGLKVIDFCEYQ